MRAFTDDDFQFGLEIALGASYRQAADVGEVLATADRIGEGDAPAWIDEWSATAKAMAAAAETARHAGRRVTALAFYRRAATYYSTALYCSAKVPDFTAEDELATWRLHRECWEHVIDLSCPAGERLQIPYEDTALRGVLFRAPDARPGERRPLLIVNNGSDGPTSSMWAHGGAAAAERGYHWMTFDGPGQQYALYEQNIPFRHDWEAALTPVIDTMLEREDVDAQRIAVIGISQGGFWVPRALCFEHRAVAAVADGGAVDIAKTWLEHLPPALRSMLDDGRRDGFDAQMQRLEQASPDATAMIEFRGRPYGISSGSRYDLYKAVEEYRLGDEVEQIDTPLLICDPEGEQLLPGQPQALYDRVRAQKKLVHFTIAEGAGRHCEPLGVGVREARVFDWLEQYMGAEQPAAASPATASGI